MSECFSEDRLDDYLLNRLAEAERAGFEEHYFNCPGCFAALQSRDLVRQAVRAAGQPPRTAPAEAARPHGLRPWLAAAGAIGALAVLTLTLGPGLWRKAPVWTPPTTDAVRGTAVAVRTPQGLMETAPAALEWHALGEGVEYAVTLNGPGLDWSGRTREARIALPAAVREAQRPGPEYRWQVKAFAPQGYFMGASETQVFRVGR